MSKYKSILVSAHSWTDDVLECVQALKKTEFSLADVYQFEKQLQALHPENRNVRAKIRQQLQVLRDLGKIEFTKKRGQYKLRRLSP